MSSTSHAGAGQANKIAVEPDVDIPGAVQCASELLDEAGLRTAPIPVERIARRLSVQVRYAPLDGDLSGMAYIKDGVRIVGVNSLHHPNRQRFTLAHELGHVMLHRPELEKQIHVDKGSLRRDALSSMGTDRLEREANAFASELLIPASLLEAAMGGGTVDLEDDEAIERLARKFRVSTTAMRYRLDRD